LKLSGCENPQSFIQDVFRGIPVPVVDRFTDRALPTSYVQGDHGFYCSAVAAFFRLQKGMIMEYRKGLKPMSPQ
jgi:hypothetical protein